MNDKPFCNAPFSQILLSPSGKVHPCCYHFGADLGSCDQKLADVWNGSKIKKIRTEFLEGKPKTCKSRIKNLNCHLDFEHLSPFVERTIHQEKSPIRIDVRLNGQCNLKCVMCDVWQQPNGLHDDGFFWKQGPSEIFPYLKEIDLLGGEPFIQKDTFRLIEDVKKCNPDCQFSFITNAQFQNSNYILKTLQGIRVKRIQISMDAMTEATFKTVRRGGDYQLFLDNLDKLIEVDAKIIVSFCTLKQNWSEIPDFYRFCKRKNVEPLLQFAFYDPSNSSSLGKSSLNELETVVRELEEANSEGAYQLFLKDVTRPLKIRIAKLRRPNFNSCTAGSDHNLQS